MGEFITLTTILDERLNKTYNTGHEYQLPLQLNMDRGLLIKRLETIPPLDKDVKITYYDAGGAKEIAVPADTRFSDKDADKTLLLDEIKYVELSDREDFNDKFVERLAFPV